MQRDDKPGLTDKQADGRLLTDSDRLRLQQLRTLEWQEHRARPAASSPFAPGEFAADTCPPSAWRFREDAELYPWQRECLDAWFKAGGRGTVKVVTGAGKTFVALAIAQRLQNQADADLRVAIVVPTIVLMNQWYDEIQARLNLPAGVVARLGGGFEEDLRGERRVLIAVLASAYRLLPEIVREGNLDKHLLLIVDECHRAGAEKASKVLATPRRWSLGLSATPERDDEDDLESGDFGDTLIGRELGELVYELSLSEAVALGIVPPFSIRHYGLPLSSEERVAYERLSRSISDARTELQGIAPPHKGSGGGFFGWLHKGAMQRKGHVAGLANRFLYETRKRKELLYRSDVRARAVERILELEFSTRPDARVILFHESIDEAMRLFRVLEANGIAVVAEHGELPQGLREEGLELFRKGVARVIVSVKALIEGFNVPAADVGIIVASSSAVRQRIQSLGRVLRRHKTQSGEEKSSVIHVLYLRDTVDDVIYDKVDWGEITGVDSNEFFTWDPGSAPERQSGPPKAPLPRDVDLPEGQLSEGDVYPGRYEGDEYSCDPQGNVRDASNAYVANAADLAERVKSTKGSFGKFRVTPKRLYVLVRVPAEEDWLTLHVTRLSRPLTNEESGSAPTDVDPAVWAASARPGDRYPFPSIPETEQLKFGQTRGGVLKRKTTTGEVYAKVGDATDPEMGSDAAKLLRAILEVRQTGFALSRFSTNALNHVTYRHGGQLYFLAALGRGLEFPSKNR